MFCPQAVAWGDVATWIGAIATCVAAGGIFLIAHRDRIERQEHRAQAARSAAVAAFPVCASVLAFVQETRKFVEKVNTGEMNPDRAIDGAKKVLELSTTATEGADMSSLPTDLLEDVTMSLIMVKLMQSRFGPGGMYSEYTGMDLVGALDDATNALEPILERASLGLWKVFRPGDNPPWVTEGLSPSPST